MGLRRSAALVGAIFLAGCLDPAGERTRRDFEETGKVSLGEIQASIDQGVVVPFADPPAGPAVHLRANAPEVTITLSSSSGQAHGVAVQLDNIDSHSDIGAAVESLVREGKTISFKAVVPAGGAISIPVTRAALHTAAPFHFAWVGDVQGGLEKFSRLRQRVNSDDTLEFVLFAGDDTENGDQAALNDFVVAADALQRPWYSAIGNHDTMWGHAGEFQTQVGRLNVAFDYKGARFMVLDSASATLDERVYQFLGGQLAGTEPALRLVALHVPPMDYEGLRDSGFSSRDEGAKLISRLVNGGVDLLLAGHLHTLHFTSSGGIEVVVSGDGGVGAADPFDGVGMHYLDVSARPDEGRFDVEVVEVP
jgi:predicted phosphodiesterase